MHPNSRTHTSGLDPGMMNDPWRIRHGYREMSVHKRAPRRNRDFKDVKYGAHIGIERYRRTERFKLLKLLPDIWQEEQQKPIKWTKAYLKGFGLGAIIGLNRAVYYYAINPVVEENILKLIGERHFSYTTLKLIKGACLYPAMAGGLTSLAYRWMMDQMRHHHEHNNRRPLYYDHIIASGILIFGWSLYFRPLQFMHAFIGSIFLSHILYLGLHLFPSRPRHPIPKVFYEKSVPKEQQDRYEFDDRIEELGRLFHGSGNLRQLMTNGSYFPLIQQEIVLDK